MIAIKRILIPTDFSETSSAAIEYAIDLAGRYQASLHLLHVIEKRAVPPEAEFPLGIFEGQTVTRERLVGLLTPVQRTAFRADFAVVIGSPSVEIARYAKAHEIDLIVMGTHGRSGVSHLLMGSVAEKVVRKAPCPVLTVRHPEHEFIQPEEESGEATVRPTQQV